MATLLKYWSFGEGGSISTKDLLLDAFTITPKDAYIPRQLDYGYSAACTEIDKESLSLIATMERDDPATTLSGMVCSNWEGKYGYYEAELKVVGGSGMSPFLWLSSKAARRMPEFMIMRGNRERERVRFYPVAASDELVEKLFSTADDLGTYTISGSTAGNYHRYGLEVFPGMCRWFFDDVLTLEYEAKFDLLPMRFGLTLLIDEVLPHSGRHLGARMKTMQAWDARPSVVDRVSVVGG